MSNPRSQRFRPRRFLKLAIRLIDDDTYNESCRIRTSIGRAYYSAFLIIKSKLESLGHSFPDDHNVHSAVIDTLMVRGYRQIGAKLDSLREVRCDADYHMNVPIKKSSGNYYVQLSQRIIDEVELLRRIS